MLTFARLREANVKRCEESFRHLDSWSPQQWFMGVTEEVGEIAQLLYRLQCGYALKEGELDGEIADAITYLDLLAARMGIDLEEAVRAKFNVVSDRKDSKVRL